MKAHAVSQTTALYKDTSGKTFEVIKKIFETYTDKGVWIVTHIVFIYPDSEVPLPFIADLTYFIPEDWTFVSEKWDYNRQGIQDNTII